MSYNKQTKIKTISSHHDKDNVEKNEEEVNEFLASHGDRIIDIKISTIAYPDNQGFIIWTIFYEN